MEITNQRNELFRRDQEYQNFLRMFYKDILFCTECLSTQSNQPFIIEPATPPRDDIELYSSKLKVMIVIDWLLSSLTVQGSSCLVETRNRTSSRTREQTSTRSSECITRLWKWSKTFHYRIRQTRRSYSSINQWSSTSRTRLFRFWDIENIHRG